MIIPKDMLSKNKITFILVIAMTGFILTGCTTPYDWKMQDGKSARSKMEQSLRDVSREYCEKTFTENDYLRITSNDEVPYQKFQSCYLDYFWPPNKNWITLLGVLTNNHLARTPSGIDLRGDPRQQEIVALAKELEQSGLKPWDIIDTSSREIRSDPPYSCPPLKYDYRRWEDYPFICDDQYVINILLEPIIQDTDIPQQELDHGGRPNVDEIPDGAYTAEADRITEIVRKPEGPNDSPVTTWSTDRSKTILLVTKVIDGQPDTILATYETPKPQISKKPYGPYLVKLTSNKWLRFNSNLTLCETVTAEQINGEYSFVNGACPFDINDIE